MEQGEQNTFETKKEEVVELLTNHGIDVSKYGKGEAKPVDSLVREVLGGETALTENERGELVREIAIATARVIHRKPDGTLLRLKEDRQEFKDGRTRNRDKILGDTAISEKLKVGEDPMQAIERAIRDEELRVGSGFAVSDEPVVSSKETTSQSYPDLTTRYNTYRFDVEFDDTAYNPEGYVEEQPDKTNYWIWNQESVE